MFFSKMTTFMIAAVAGTDCWQDDLLVQPSEGKEEEGPLLQWKS